jgi:hypothetical protein
VIKVRIRPSESPAMNISKKAKIPGVLLITAAVIVVGFVALRSVMFPYGGSHCCLKGLWMSLEQYAQKHDGRFPSGQASPEASLSLLYREELSDANVLRGKSVPLDVVEKTLNDGELLTPDSCGWHYIEGLTLGDDRRIAIVWDKAGLSHNGQNLFGGHSVLFLDGTERVIPKSDWSKFLLEQEGLVAARTRRAVEGVPLVTAKVLLPTGEVVDHFDGGVLLSCTASIAGRNSGSSSIGTSPLIPGLLKWWQFPISDLKSGEQGTMTLSLEVNDWHFAPVTISVVDGVASPSDFVFEIPHEAGLHAK